MGSGIFFSFPVVVVQCVRSRKVDIVDWIVEHVIVCGLCLDLLWSGDGSGLGKIVKALVLSGLWSPRVLCARGPEKRRGHGYPQRCRFRSRLESIDRGPWTDWVILRQGGFAVGSISRIINSLLMDSIE